MKTSYGARLVESLRKMREWVQDPESWELVGIALAGAGAVVLADLMAKADLYWLVELVQGLLSTGQ